LKPTIALLSVLLVAACNDGTTGPPPGTRSVPLNTVADGVSGTVLMTKEATTRSTVWVTLRGVVQGVTYTGSISRGTCQARGAVVVTLNAVTAGSSVAAATTRSVPDSVLAAGYHLVYSKPGLPPPPVACGNLD
jgi:hypothetical protein